jgi:hypothetical protein
MAQLQAAARGALARRAGVAYSRTFRDGALGMEVVDLEVRALLIPGQAQALGVATGSVITRFGGTELVDGTADLVLAAASKPRPVVVDFWLRLPASRRQPGAVWRLAGALSGEGVAGGSAAPWPEATRQGEALAAEDLDFRRPIDGSPTIDFRGILYGNDTSALDMALGPAETVGWVCRACSEQNPVSRWPTADCRLHR